MSRYQAQSVIGLVLLIFLAVGSGDTNSPSGSPTKRSDSVSVGENGVVDSGADVAFLGVTKDAYDEIQKAMSAKDKLGVVELLSRGKLIMAKRNTKVLVIDRNFLLIRVRLLEGDSVGALGWLPFEYVHR